MIKKYGFPVFMAIIVTGLIIAALNKDKLYDLLTRQIQKQNTSETEFQAKEYIEKHFNYNKNKQDFEFTLLQFKSTGCNICKQMEPVIEEIRNEETFKVKVQVIQIMNPDSQEMMKFFGISAVPMHIVLNKEGKEVFRNYGFIAAEELRTKFLSNK